jgi:hypothetical protein
MRYSEDKPEDLNRARTAVAEWRDLNPEGTGAELVSALGAQFHPDYAPVLRAVLFTVDRHRGRELTGIITEDTMGRHKRAP